MKIKILFTVASFFLLNLSQAQWYSQTFTPLIYDFKTIYFINPDTGWAAGLTIVKTIDGGNTWQDKYIPNDFIHSIFFTDNNDGWAVGSKYIYHTINGGDTWNYQIPDSSYTLSQVIFVNQDTGWIVGIDNNMPQGGVLLKTVDGGDNWTSRLFPDTSLVSICFLNDSMGWMIGNLNFLFETKDAGNNWSVLTTPPNIFLGSIFFSDSIQGWSAFGDNIYHTIDGGTNWVLQYSNLNMNIIKIVFVNNDTGWAISCNQGVILNTMDGGSNWNVQQYSSNLFDVFFIDSHRGWAVGESNIYKTINGGGIFVADNGYLVNNKINLLTIDPNPITEETEISLQLKESGNILIKIYDVYGKVIKNIKITDTSIHKMPLCANNFTPGTYICEMINSNTSEILSTKRIVKIR